MTPTTIQDSTRELAAAIASGDGDHGERAARATWTSIAEPGDSVAGTLIASLGAAAALEAILAGADARTLAQRVGGDVDEIAAAIARWMPRASLATTDRALIQAARLGLRLLTPGDELWPAQLEDLGPQAPTALWTLGDAQLLARLDRSVAIVGSRAATSYGEHVTGELTSSLVDAGVAIVSGAAYGIDGAAHRAALAAGGTTIAVLAGGLDRVYPAGHEALIGRIAERGVVASELAPGTAPTRWRFLSRNRILAAVSSATVVVEAGWRSGSLNTAAHAAALGRPVGAVPGPVTSAASTGAHRLIRDHGATLVTTAEEIADLIR